MSTTTTTAAAAAAVAKSWQGSQPPANWAQVDKDLHDARANLEAFIKSLLFKEDNQ